jgi:hypothetical protein
MRPTPRWNSRPVLAALGIGLLAFGGLAGAGAPALAGADVRGDPAREGCRKVHFAHRPAAGTRAVHVAGSWNGWSPADPTWALGDPDGDGTFEGTFDVPRGHQTYKFVDDDRWTQDPDQAASEDDGHGGKNSVLEVGEVGGGGGAQGSEGSGAFGTTRIRPQAFLGELYLLQPGTDHLPDLERETSVGRIYADVIDIAPRGFEEGFPGLTDRYEWFAVKYRGTYKAEKTGLYRFRIVSDDGSKLWIDGALAIDDDGLHEPREAVRIVKLRAGPHDLRLDYMQGPAKQVALQFYVTEAGSTSETLVRVSAPRAPVQDGASHPRAD